VIKGRGSAAVGTDFRPACRLHGVVSDHRASGPPQGPEASQKPGTTVSLLERGRVITVAAKDTGGQERASKHTDEVDEEFVDETSELKDRHAKLSEDVDDVLDEIDEVLETDAESFVRGFVQKGGE